MSDGYCANGWYMTVKLLAQTDHKEKTWRITRVHLQPYFYAAKGQISGVIAYTCLLGLFVDKLGVLGLASS